MAISEVKTNKGRKSVLELVGLKDGGEGGIIQNFALALESDPRKGGILTPARNAPRQSNCVRTSWLERTRPEQAAGDSGMRVIAGGEGGIRTLGTLLEYGALAKRCFRPLSHLTNCVRE